MALAVALVAASCGSGEKDSICTCIAAGKALDKKASEVLSQGATETNRKELQALKADQQQKCKEFQLMGGEEMKQRMAGCEE